MTFGNGHYTRKSGTWVYAATGEPVPGASDMRLGTRTVMVAPEVQPDALLTTEQVAELARVKPESLRSMISRGEGPAAVFKFGNQPVWSRPIIDHWMASRPRRGPTYAAA